MASKYYSFFVFIEKQINLFFYLITYRRHSKAGNNRLLITKLDHIGDFVLFSSSLKVFRELFPIAHITLLVQDGTYNAAELCPYIDEIWQINQRSFRRNLLTRIRWAFKMKDGNFDTAINAVFSPSVQFFDCLVGFTHAKRRIGFACGERCSERGKPYYTELVPEVHHTLFEIDKNFSLLNYLGYKGAINRLPEVWLSSEDMRCAQNLLSELGGAKYGILFPGSRQSFKIWPLEDYCRVLNRVKECCPIHWIICGSNAEAGLCSTIANRLQKNGISSFNLAGKTSIRELAAIIKGASVYLGNDTMAVHLAAAFNVPSVCLLGGGHYGRFYPYPGNPLTRGVTKQLSCFGCNWDCTSSEVECISGVTVDQVVSSLISLAVIPQSEY